MFIDNVSIYVKAGNGGNGAITFHREKYIDSVYSVIDWDKIGKLYEDYLKEI